MHSESEGDDDNDETKDDGVSDDDDDDAASSDEDEEEYSEEDLPGFIDDKGTFTYEGIYLISTGLELALEVDPSDDESESSNDESEDPSKGSFKGLGILTAGGPGKTENSSDEDTEEEDEAAKKKKAAYFAPEADESTRKEAKSFLGFNLSRPILRAVQAMNFSTPTPIQRKAIPIALQGLDVLGSAVTGSGKTAAFMIPILERLMFKDRNGAGEIRVLILTPTRELAVQCAEVGKSLAKFMDISFAVIVGKSNTNLRGLVSEILTYRQVACH